MAKGTDTRFTARHALWIIRRGRGTPAARAHHIRPMFTWSSRAWRQTVTWVVKASTRALPGAARHGDDASTVGGSGSHREHTTLGAGFDVALHGVAHGGEHVQGFHGDGRERPVDVDLDPQALAEPGLLQRQVVPHDGELVPEGAGGVGGPVGGAAEVGEADEQLPRPRGVVCGEAERGRSR